MSIQRGDNDDGRGFRRSEDRAESKLVDVVQIVDFNPDYQASFRQLNEEWIARWFTMEVSDYKVLDEPQKYVLDGGGQILIALLNGEAVGTAALIKVDDQTFELAKMCVAPEVRGRRIGLLLTESAISRARSLGARKVCLESNRILAPAIRLYTKLGFKEIDSVESPYTRCDIRMELLLE